LQTQEFLESRIEHLSTLEDRIKMIEDKCEATQDITLATKKDIFESMNKAKGE
jgi:3-methyladenine DNA glycosylase/8-oxoguanine DNA glycosylase